MKQTYREQLMLFLASMVFLMVLGYQKSLKGSLEIKKECERLENEIARSEQLIEDMPQLEARYHQSMSKETGWVEKESLQEQILYVLSSSKEKYNVQLASFDPLHSYKENGYLIDTQAFTLKGSFEGSTRFIHQMEQQSPLSRISSTEYFTEQNYTSGKKELYAKIYLQRITRP